MISQNLNRERIETEEGRRGRKAGGEGWQEGKGGGRGKGGERGRDQRHES